MKRRTFIKNLGLAASLPWLGRTALAAPGAASQANPASHKILSCNIRVDLPEDAATGNGWVHRRELCVDVMRAQKANLIGLQEAQEIHLKDLKSRMPEFDSFAMANPDTVFHPSNAILFLRARYELISAGGFWLSETPHVAGSKSWDSGRSRFANWVHLKERSSGKELRFWNTHLDHISHEARTKGAALIVQACEAFPKEFPQLLSGDMNAGVAHPAIKNFKAGGWLDTYTAVNGPDDPGFTFHGFKGPKSAGKRADGEIRTKIDWIFCRGAVKPLAAAIIRDERNDRYPSDHYFVWAVMEL